MTLKNNPLSPAKNPDLRQIVYDKLKEAIVEGVIRPGSKLSEIDLADKLAVSRTPVREAIRQLAQTGLVTLTPRRGAYVTLPTKTDADDLYELRRELEKMAVRNICLNPPKHKLMHYKEIFSNMTDDTEHSEYLVEDQDFHQFLYQECGNNYLQKMLENIMDLINLCRTYSIETSIDLTDFTEGHIKIIDSIIAGKCKEAVEEMNDHIGLTKKGLLEFLEAHPEGVINGKTE